MAGKSPQDILMPIGLKGAKDTLDLIYEKMEAEPFTGVLAGSELEDFATECSELKKKAAVAQKQIVQLDNRVRKWKEVPSEVAAELKHWRQKASN
eukprot:9061171-Alexandrium_andersonii.AAC.1